ncbi:hypothetical protein OAG75_01105 [bacterium]|nr:hypothetical protein [bacterium]
MNEERWAQISPHLEEFQHHLAPHLPKLHIELLNDRRWSDETFRLQRQTGAFNRYGVYIMFDCSENLEYVGVAMNRFDDRVWSHDSNVERMLTDVISIPHEYYFLGLALEFFLICRLQPPKNKVYKGYTIPEFQVEIPGIEKPA